METLLYFAFWAGLIFLMMRFGCGAHVMGHGHDKQPNDRSSSRAGQLRWVPPETDVDPVCGKTVHPDEAKSSVYNGTVYYFCSADHRDAFEAAPERYVGADTRPQLEHEGHVDG